MRMKPVNHFLLVPNRADVRRVSRLVAEKHPSTRIQVGTIHELIHQVADHFLVEPEDSDWLQAIEKTAKDIPAPFWSKSLAVAPEATLNELRRSLLILLEGLPVGTATLPVLVQDRVKDNIEVPERLSRYYNDLSRLQRGMGEDALPAPIRKMQAALKSDPANHLAGFVVYQPPIELALTPLQTHFIQQINAGSPCPELQELLDQALARRLAAKENSNLHFLQRNLFQTAGSGMKNPAGDDSLQWLQCRDPLEEAETVVAMIQSMMRNDGVSWEDFAILLPEDPRYAVALSNAASAAGMPVSGLEVDRVRRDMGVETVRSFIQCAQPPRRTLAQADLLSSPLMPWTQIEGRRFAARAAEGRLTWKTEDRYAEIFARLFHHYEKPGALTAGLKWFDTILSANDLPDQLASAREKIGTLIDCLDDPVDADAVPWGKLRALLNSDSQPDISPVEITREGVAIFNENESPWREVKHLFVLGFSEGHYPQPPARSPVFPDGSLKILNDQLGLRMELPETLQKRRRERFLRHICSASETCRFFYSVWSDNEWQRPSESFAFMAQVLGTTLEGLENRIILLETAEGRNQIRGFPGKSLHEVKPFRAEVPERLEFNRDLLLDLRKSTDGRRPESPSGLEKLMISPLAWLLYRGGLLSQEWLKESLEVSTQGSIAHGVFERLFRRDADIPDEHQIVRRIGADFAAVCDEHAPLLSLPGWKIERANLLAEIKRAALEWANIMRAMKVEILGAEILLEGNWNDLPLKGYADLLAKAEDGHLLVVDYKKSGSKQRKERMQAGFDHQAALYQKMAATGKEKLPESLREAINQSAQSKKSIGSIYYMMNDRIALADSFAFPGSEMDRVEKMDGDISGNAMEMITERIIQVKRGEVRLNHDGDEARFEKLGISAKYTLNDSPLLSMFSQPEEDDGEIEDE